MNITIQSGGWLAGVAAVIIALGIFFKWALPPMLAWMKYLDKRKRALSQSRL